MKDIREERRCHICGQLFNEHSTLRRHGPLGDEYLSELEECVMFAKLDYYRQVNDITDK